VEDERQIIVVVSSVANGYLVPKHVIFIGITLRCLPPSNEGKINCISFGWHFTFNETH
jgi:hypothetical protein